MRDFIAGATGVLGRRIVESLVHDGHQVTAAAIHRDELLAEAGHARLVRLARAGKPMRRRKRDELEVDRAEATPSSGPADGLAGDEAGTDRPELERDPGVCRDDMQRW